MIRYILICLFTISFLQAADFYDDFEKYAPYTLPKGWSVAATHPGSTTAKWQITIDHTRPPSNQHVLTLTKAGKSTFNLCYRSDIRMQNGSISVLFHANSGRIDQGGGIMWRVQDANNYYVARFNPLEDNFRFYSVIDGYRRLICTNDTVHLSKGWHSMTIKQQGKHFRGYIDGTKLLECQDDRITKSGGAGLWTKADAATSFDDFQLKAQ